VRASSLALIERNIEATHNHSKATIKRNKLNESIAQKRKIIIVQQTRNKIIAEMKKKWKNEFEHWSKKRSKMQMLELNETKLLQKTLN